MFFFSFHEVVDFFSADHKNTNLLQGGNQLHLIALVLTQLYHYNIIYRLIAI